MSLLYKFFHCCYWNYSCLNRVLEAEKDLRKIHKMWYVNIMPTMRWEMRFRSYNHNSYSYNHNSSNSSNSYNNIFYWKSNNFLLFTKIRLLFCCLFLALSISFCLSFSLFSVLKHKVSKHKENLAVKNLAAGYMPLIHS